MRLPAASFIAWPALLIWLLSALGLFLLDGWWSLGNLALLLVLGSTLASFWLSTSVCVLVSAVAVAGFNWFFVTPRHTFHVQLDQDLLLLVTLLATSTVTSVLTSRLRQHAQAQTEQARHAGHLQQLAAALQHASTPQDQVDTACQLLQQWTGLRAHVWLQDQAPGPDDPLRRAWQASQQAQGCMGPGTGQHESLRVWAWPLRAGVQRMGTLLLGPCHDDESAAAWSVEKLSSLARLLADALQRLQSDLQTRQAQEQLQAQQLRNTLLAAISHDYRTPLATITSAASALQASPGPLSVQAAAQTILDEAAHLHRMTSNTLQMARLDRADACLQAQWESVEELCGAALAAARRRHPGRLLQAEVPAGLPLLHADAVLLVQLLDNLLENALRYSPDDQAVVLQACQQTGPEGASVELAVLDRGAGIAPAWRERVFDPFFRVLPEGPADRGFADAQRRGMGLGLALCRAIARAHHAHLWIEDRQGGGTRVGLRFEPQAQPISPREPAL